MKLVVTAYPHVTRLALLFGRARSFRTAHPGNITELETARVRWEPVAQKDLAGHLLDPSEGGGESFSSQSGIPYTLA